MDSNEKLTLWIFGLVLFGVVTFGFVKFTGGINITYSDGHRIGCITKLSKKGVLFKTWEGEMQMGAMAGDGKGSAVPHVWEFSVPSDDVAKKIEEAMNSGARIKVHYKQVWMNGWSNGDTDYYVDSIELP